MGPKGYKTLALMAVLLAAGCGDGGVARHDLYGQVTYQGAPVPYGNITFRPDRSKGGSGPTGYAEIIEGEYTTDDSGGKGAIVGPTIIIVEGAVSNMPLAAALFPTYKMEVDVAKDVDNLDIEVPEQAPPNKRGRARR